MSEYSGEISSTELTRDQAKARIIDALDDNQREVSGLRSEVEAMLSDHPELRDDFTIFEKIAANAYIYDLVALASPEVIAMLPGMPESVEDAKKELIAYISKYTNFPPFIAAKLKAYFEIYPDLCHDQELFTLIAKDRTLEHLLVFASPEVMEHIDKTSA